MEERIRYTTASPEDFGKMLALYERLGWNSLKLTVNELERMFHGSWSAIYAYDHERLVGSGRIISDGVITGLICGVGVLPEYQSKGIGKEMMCRLVQHCKEHGIIPQLMCVESLESYYEAIGFRKFTSGMKMDVDR